MFFVCRWLILCSPNRSQANCTRCSLATRHRAQHQQRPQLTKRLVARGCIRCSAVERSASRTRHLCSRGCSLRCTSRCAPTRNAQLQTNLLSVWVRAAAGSSQWPPATWTHPTGCSSGSVRCCAPPLGARTCTLRVHVPPTGPAPSVSCQHSKEHSSSSRADGLLVVPSMRAQAQAHECEWWRRARARTAGTALTASPRWSPRSTTGCSSGSSRGCAARSTSGTATRTASTRRASGWCDLRPPRPLPRFRLLLPHMLPPPSVPHPHPRPPRVGCHRCSSWAAATTASARPGAISSSTCCSWAASPASAASSLANSALCCRRKAQWGTPFRIASCQFTARSSNNASAVNRSGNVPFFELSLVLLDLFCHIINKSDLRTFLTLGEPWLYRLNQRLKNRGGGGGLGERRGGRFVPTAIWAYLSILVRAWSSRGCNTVAVVLRETRCVA